MVALLLLLAEVVETPHYRLHAEAPAAEADEFGRVLEAAWTRFGEYFKATPKLGKGERLTVRFFEKREDWAKAIIADRAIPPGDAGGYYWPDSKTAYLYRQPTGLYTRTLLIHEAAHQFHFLARTKNRRTGCGWYDEGVAEFLAAHTWDGETLHLGVLPHVTLQDYAAAALHEASAPGFRLDDVLAADRVSRPLGWAIYRFAATSGGSGVATWRRKMNSGGSARSLFQRAFGRGKKLQARFVEWLAAHQQPFAQIFNEWQSAGPKALRGFAGVVSACRLKGDSNELAGTLVPPGEGRWKAGLLLSYTDERHYVLAMVSDGNTVVVESMSDGHWQELDRQRVPTAQRLRAHRTGARSPSTSTRGRSARTNSSVRALASPSRIATCASRK